MRTDRTQNPGSLRQRQKEQARQLIRDTAYALFEEKGFHESTMRELAARAGVGLGTIFRYYPDKASLLFAAFTEDMEAVLDEAFASLPTGVRLRAQLLHLVRGIFEFYAARPELSRTLIKESLFPQGEWAERLEGLVLTFLGRVGQLFESARERGEVDPDLDLQDALASFWGLYFICLIGALRAPTFDVGLWLDTLERLLEQQYGSGT